MFTRRIFDGVVITVMGLNLGLFGLFRIWGRKAVVHDTGWKRTAGAALLQATGR